MDNNHGILASALVLWLLMVSIIDADKLSPGQRPPLGASISGGILLAAPLVGNSGADVGRRTDVGRSGGGAPPAPKPPPRASAPAPQAPPQEDGVVREETEDLKEIDGHPVRVVKGSLGYNSPEGLPVSIKYSADENGNRASFTIGKPGSGGGGGGGGGGAGGSKAGGGSGGSKSGGGGDGTKSGGNNGGGGKTPGAGGSGSGKSGASTYLPPTMMKVDKTYLPPS